MAILIRAVQRRNPGDKNAAPKWYPVQNTIEQMNETEVAEMIADETTLNPAEALMAVRQFPKVLRYALLNGKSVRMGNWGSFYPTLHTIGADTKEKLTAANIKKVNMVFKPSDALKADLQKATFVWLDKPKAGSGSGSGETPSGGETPGGDDRPEIE